MLRPEMRVEIVGSGFIRAAMGVDSKDMEALIKDVVRHLELHGEMCVGLSFLFVI